MSILLIKMKWYSINLIFNKVDNLLKVYNKRYSYCMDKFDFVKYLKILEYNKENFNI
jgi:hypothetical protein